MGARIQPKDGIAVEVAALDVSLSPLDAQAGAIGGTVRVVAIRQPAFTVGQMRLTKPTIPTIPDRADPGGDAPAGLRDTASRVHTAAGIPDAATRIHVPVARAGCASRTARWTVCWRPWWSLS